MDAGILVPLAGIFMIIAIVVGPAWLKSRERREMQATLRSAIEKGQPLPTDVIESMSRENARPAPTAQRDLRRGVMWLAVSLGVATAGYFFGFEENDAVYPIIGIAAVPGFVGLAFIILSLFNKNKG